MVHAELNYNPYLLKTEVRFNGNPPRINSLVEKYQGENLQTWVNEIPSIFYDEMNGYDFELDFFGTELDFEELKKAFAKAGVGKDLVQLFHKGELNSRDDKSTAINFLLKWLEDNPNRKFDSAAFRIKYRDLFEGAYPMVVIGGTVSFDSLLSNTEISLENVESVDELRKTDLHSTPILFYLDRKSAGSLQHNLTELLKRNDITQEQLFFMIDPVLRGKAERVVSDLGVREPQVVTMADVSSIYRYIELFPESEFIYDSIRAFREQTESLGNILENENRQSEITNKDIHEKIKDYESILERLRTVKELFLNKDNLDIPEDMKTARTRLIDKINCWKIKKTKITKPEEARLLAYELDSEVSRYFEEFREDINNIYAMQSAAITACCEDWYKSARYKEDFTFNGVEPGNISMVNVQRIAEELLKFKEERYVMPKEDFFGKLFKTIEETPAKPVLETTYYCEKWRSYASRVVVPVADEVISEAFLNLEAFFNRLAKTYIEWIENLIQKVSEEKEQVSAHLSEDERLLQADNDWYTVFCEKLRDIERS